MKVYFLDRRAWVSPKDQVRIHEATTVSEKSVWLLDGRLGDKSPVRHNRHGPDGVFYDTMEECVAAGIARNELYLSGWEMLLEEQESNVALWGDSRFPEERVYPLLPADVAPADRIEGIVWGRIGTRKIRPLPVVRVTEKSVWIKGVNGRQSRKGLYYDSLAECIQAVVTNLGYDINNSKKKIELARERLAFLRQLSVPQ